MPGLLLSFFLALGGATCALAGQDGKLPAENSPAPRTPAEWGGPAGTEPVDDQQIIRNLEKAAAELVAAGRTVKMAVLIGQLQTKKCAVDLAAPSKESIPAETFYQRMKASVLVFAGYYKCSKCGKYHVATASGYAISKSGICVTNYHVVNAPSWETLVAMTAAGRVLPVQAVLAASSADDVAIVQVGLPTASQAGQPAAQPDSQDLAPAALAADAPVGSRVRVINHPDGRFFVFTEGVISRYFKAHRKEGDAAMLAITADFAKGSSGSPVFNECGAVVGMVASTASIYYNVKEGHREDLQMVVKECVPASSILRLIEPSPGSSPQRTQRNTEVLERK